MYMTSSKTFSSLLVLMLAMFVLAALALSSAASAASKTTVRSPTPQALAKGARPDLSPAGFIQAVGPTTPAAFADSPDIPEGEAIGSSPSLLTEPAGSLATMGSWQDTFQCTQQWGYVAARRNSYVIGNCHRDWSLARTTRDFESRQGSGYGYWDGGYINGGFNGCGWMRQADSSYSSGYDTTACQNPDYANCDFMYCDAAYPSGVIWGSDNDASPPQQLKTDCVEFANFRPWAPGQVPATAGAADGVTLRKRFRGEWLSLRYLAKHPWVYQGRNYPVVMIKDPAVPKDVGAGNWAFVLAQCFW